MKDEIISVLKKVDAIITDSHIVLVSGKHTSAYINPDKLFPHTKEVSKIGKKLAQKFKHRKIDIIVGPAIGGIIISQWVAHHLSRIKGRNILSLFTEKTPDKKQIFERGFDKLIKGKKVLVVEDITTTGGSAKYAADSVKSAGGKVVAVAVIVNRDPKKVTRKSIGYPFVPLTVFEIDSYAEKDCPLCKREIPVNPNIGHGREYLARQK